MIIMPPEDLRKYITVNESGQWIHDPEMPSELESKFMEFVENVKKAKEYRIEE